MAGNKRNTRKPAAKNNSIKKVAGAALPTLRLPPPKDVLQRQVITVMTSLNGIINGKGDFVDWMNVLFRLYFGKLSISTYFKPHSDVLDAINKAIVQLTIVKLRTHVTGTFGILVHELDDVTFALSYADEAARSMNVDEHLKIHKDVDAQFDRIVKGNYKYYPKDAAAPLTNNQLAAVAQVTINDKVTSFHVQDPHTVIAANRLIKEAA